MMKQGQKIKCKQIQPKYMNEKVRKMELQEFTPQKQQNLKIDKTVINFEPRQYPFRNRRDENSCIYKTSLNIDVTQEESIKKLTSSTHENIISIENIQRSSSKFISKAFLTYSLTYEQVPFSVKNIGLQQSCDEILFKMVAQSNFEQILSEVTAFLLNLGVNHIIKLKDIGITKDGVIKIFIPPSALCADVKNKSTKQQLLNHIYKLTNWWETTFSISQIIIEPSQKQKPSKISIFDIPCKTSKTLTYIENFPQKQQSHQMNYVSSPLKSKNKELKSKLQQITKRQKQRLRMFNEEVKAIKQKIKNRQKLKNATNVHRKIYKSSEQIPERQNFFDKQRFERSKRINKIVENEGIQQNINCINIYNSSSNNNFTNATLKESFLKLSFEPVLSFSIAPTAQEPKTSTTPNLALEKAQPYFDTPFEEVQNEQSFDTYDVEINLPNEAFFNDLKPHPSLTSLDREVSERNYRIRKQKIKKQRESKKICQNKVESHRVITQSAGHLQFKNIINQFIKPQVFLKNTNICEDPMEHESQNSHQQIQKPQRENKYRNTISGTHDSKDSEKKQNSIDQEKIKKEEEKMLRIYSNSKISLTKVGKQKKIQTFMKPNLDFKEQMRRKVESVLERTKKVINILKKKRKEGSPDVRARFATTISYQ